ncbi:S-adenosyl-L-methionine-dependent methyltransferase [Coprinopsis marcescibilis]|uniref:DNA (cytosine-5-)-methyltransferase n=1 Tax=Coprinopsis marcescibilis TaxID=230819 RepID=A0A5C3KCN6_COPMA|nr:S-adenosyl-L-methionine-dependent methyltransferase [Coprinopsis marcescibilis]
MSKRHRPTALDVSFQDEEPDRQPTKRVSSQTSRPATPLKRLSEAPEDTRALKRSLPAVSHYANVVEAQEIEETAGLDIPGEDPDDQNSTVRVNNKIVRMLDGFTVFDPNHRREMVSLAALESPDRHDRQIRVIGYVKACYKDGTDEDEGQEEEEIPPYVHLNTIERYSIDFTKKDDPVWIETKFAFYILDTPSEQYAAFFQHFYTPRCMAQAVISTAIRHPRTGWDEFMTQFTETVDMFGETWRERDLNTSQDEIYEALEEVVDIRKGLLETPIIQRFLRKFQRAAPSQSRPLQRRKRHVERAIPVGNKDLWVLRPENQNPTHVTPLIASLAKGLVLEELKVVGPPPRAPNRAALEEQRKKRQAQVIRLIKRGRNPNRKYYWRREDKLSAGSAYLSRITVEDEEYKVGDVVVTMSDLHPVWNNIREDPGYIVPGEARHSDYFWFAYIHRISHENGTAHAQWFEHGSFGSLKELANQQELYLTNLCDELPVKNILGKISLKWKCEEDTVVGSEEFFCWKMFNRLKHEYVEIDWVGFDSAKEAETCPSCIHHDTEREKDAFKKIKDDDGKTTGIAFEGKEYHDGDFVLYRPREVDGTEVLGPANIGQISQVKVLEMSRNYYVIVRKVGRIMDVRPEILKQVKVLRDERHLFLTKEIEEVKIDRLLDVIYAPCRESVEGKMSLQKWFDISPHHCFIEYEFPTMNPTSWDQRVKIDCGTRHHVCRLCWKDKLEEIKERRTFLEELRENPMRVLDLFGGVGAFSMGLVEGSGGMMRVEYAVEISPSAARTFKKNSPRTKVTNQCANVVLEFWIKYWEGHDIKFPVQLEDGTKIPPPPPKSFIQAIVAGFPCQAHSSLNRFKKANDPKNNLVLNALSFVDAIRPDLVMFENVPGFLFHRLNAKQVSECRVEGGVENGGVKLVVRALGDMGYQVRLGLLHAGHYGTPQDRRRLFIIAARMGVPFPDFPQPSHAFPGSTQLEIKLPYGVDKGKDLVKLIRTQLGTAAHYPVTVEDAIDDLPLFDWKLPNSGRNLENPARDALNRKEFPELECSVLDRFCGFKGTKQYHHAPTTRYQLEARIKPTSNLQHFTRVFDARKVRKVIKVPLRAGANHRHLQIEEHDWQGANPVSHSGRKRWRTKQYLRLDRKGFFATTVTNVDPTAKQSRILHPTCRRIVTVRELARSQGFPDSFVFESNNDNVITMHRQIGNAVPLPLGRAMGREVFKVFFEKWRASR